jgi:hypothetical protein
MAATGFLVNPLIVDNNEAMMIRFQQDYKMYANDINSALNKAVKFRVGCDKMIVLCGRRATVAFEGVHGLSLGDDVDSGKFYKIIGQQYDFDAEVMGVRVPSPVEQRTAFGELFYQFHAPSRIMIHKPGGALKLKAFYGLHPTSYEQGGATDGVELTVRLVTTNGTEKLIVRRDLDPIKTLSDRGEQLLDVNLPSDEGTLFIETDPKRGAEYDQFVIRKLNVMKQN